MHEVLKKPTARCLAASGAGVLHYLSTLPGWWPAVFVSLVPLYWAVRGQSLKTALGLGWLCGLACVIPGFAWLPRVFSSFSGWSWPAVAGACCLFAAWHALRWALLTSVCSVLAAAGRDQRLGFFAAHAITELTFPSVFPWYLATSLSDVPMLLQTAELGGPIAASSLIVAGNLGVVTLCDCWSRAAAKTLVRELVREKVALALCSSTLVFGFVFAGARMHTVDAMVASAPSATVGIVQANESPEQKRDPDASRARQLALSRSLPLRELDLLLWSETSVPGLVPELSGADFLRNNLTLQLRVPLIAGVAFTSTFPGEPAPSEIYNSAFVSDAAGDICRTCRYDKQLRLPVGEYVPWGERLPWLRSSLPNAGRIAAGKRDGTLRVGQHRVDVSICYEDLHPTRFNRELGGHNAELLVNLTNDMWFDGSPAVNLHARLARLRAIEQRRFSIRATNSGLSSVVDPVGRVQFRLEPGVAAAGTASVKWLTGQTVYHLIGNSPWWLLTCASAFSLGLGRRRAAKP